MILTPYLCQTFILDSVVLGIFFNRKVWCLPNAEAIDFFQGRDKECIIVSFVRSSVNSKASGSLLGDWHRINVLLTRAKVKQ